MPTFNEIAARRHSARVYDPSPVDPLALETVLEAARLAPTAANRQAFQIIVVKDRHQRRAVADSYEHTWLLSAPVLLVVTADPDQAWVRSDGMNYAMVDAAIAMDHLTLSAADLGLGTCWIAAFDPDILRRALGLPARVQPVAFTPLGHPLDHPSPKKRKPLGELVRHDRW
jgi:nitroreductase